MAALIGDCTLFVNDECADIVIEPTSGLDANAPYFWTVYGTQGDSYTGTDFTDGNGFLTIPKAKLPLGFLVHGQVIEVKIKDTEDDPEFLTLNFDDHEVTTLTIQFEKVI
jgi:hypothetical protein